MQTSMGKAEKVDDLISFRTRKAVQWAMTVWEAGDMALSSFKCFLELFQHVFEHCPERGCQ